MAMVDELKVRLAERRRIAEPGRPSSIQQLKLFTSPENKTQGLAWEPGHVGPRVPETVVEAPDSDFEQDIQRLRLGTPASRGSSGLGRSSSCTATATKTGVSGKAKRKLLQQQLADVTAERDGAFEENRRLHDQLRDAFMQNEALQSEAQTLRGAALSAMPTATLEPTGLDSSQAELIQRSSSAQLEADLRSALEDLRQLLADEEEKRTRQIAAAAEGACSCGLRLAAIERAAEVLALLNRGAEPVGAEPAGRAPHVEDDSWLGASLAARAPRQNVLSRSVSVPVLEDTIRRPSRDACAPAELEVLADQLRMERQYWLETLKD